MSLRQKTPCDYDGICPYSAEYGHDCEYWCGADEPQDSWEDDEAEYEYWLEQIEKDLAQEREVIAELGRDYDEDEE